MAEHSVQTLRSWIKRITTLLFCCHRDMQQATESTFDRPLTPRTADQDGDGILAHPLPFDDTGIRGASEQEATQAPQVDDLLADYLPEMVAGPSPITTSTEDDFSWPITTPTAANCHVFPAAKCCHVRRVSSSRTACNGKAEDISGGSAATPLADPQSVHTTQGHEELSWNSTEADYEKASEAAVVAAFIHHGHEGRVARVSHGIFIKRSLDCARREFAHQHLAWCYLNHNKLCDGRSLRIPRPVRVLEAPMGSPSSREFLVMEYLEGCTLEAYLQANELNQSEYLTLARALVCAICQLWQLTNSDALASTTFGPLTGEPAIGFPWGMYGIERTLRSSQDLQSCLDKRFKRRPKRFERPTFDVSNASAGLCHMDLAFRNIQILPNGDIGLLDWGFSNCYPFEFEIAALWRQYRWTQVDNEKVLFRMMIQELESVCGFSDLHDKDRPSVQTAIHPLTSVDRISTERGFSNP